MDSRNVSPIKIKLGVKMNGGNTKHAFLTSAVMGGAPWQKNNNK